MSKITYPNKATGDQFKAAEANEIKASVNALYDDKLKIEVSNSFASISNSTEKRIILVLQDETNEPGIGLYIHDGNKLNWIPTQEI